MDFTTLMQKLERTGTRLDSLENAVAAIKARVAFWRKAALVASGLAVVFALAYFNLRKRYEREKRTRIAA